MTHGVRAQLHGDAHDIVPCRARRQQLLQPAPQRAELSLITGEGLPPSQRGYPPPGAPGRLRGLAGADVHDPPSGSVPSADDHWCPPACLRVSCGPRGWVGDVMSLAAYLPTTPTLSHAKSKTIEVTSVQA